MDQKEVGRATFAQTPGVGFSQQIATVGGHRPDGVERVETGRDQALDLPGELIGPE